MLLRFIEPDAFQLELHKHINVVRYYLNLNDMRWLIIWIIMSISSSATGQITKIEHFYVSSPNANQLYTFFKDSFGLPKVWDFRSYSEFESGGLSLGNVVLEFVKFKDSTKTAFIGIALEPKQSAQQIVPVLDKAEIKHDTVQSFVFNNNNKDTSFSLLRLTGILPEVNLFICDYKRRQGVREGRKKAADSLRRIHGGNLGIQSLKEIVVGCRNVSVCRSEFSKIPGFKREGNDLFAFSSGPALRLINARNGGGKKIVIKVSSVEATKNYLLQKNLLGSATKSKVSIKSQLADGLLIELVDK